MVRTKLTRVVASPVLSPWLTPPPMWGGSLPEWSIEWAFNSLGWIDGVTYFYQSPFAGGRQFPGGGVLDFYVPMLNLGIRVQGIYFHYGKGADVVAYDKFQKVQLEALGIRVIDIDEDMALDNPIAILKDALNGIDKSRGRNN